METVLINGKNVPVLAHGADWSAAQLSGAVVKQCVHALKGSLTRGQPIIHRMAEWAELYLPLKFSVDSI